MAVSARYWRWRATGDRYLATLAWSASYYEIRFWEGAVNKSLGGTASASSKYNVSFAAAKANDGNTGSRWANDTTGAPETPWWAVDTGGVCSPDTIELVCKAGPAVTFAVDYSTDGSNWTELAEYTISSPTDTDATYTVEIQGGGGTPLIDGMNSLLIDGGLMIQ